MIARGRPRRRAGFTLVELTVSGLLVGLIAALLAAAWPAFDRAAAEVAMRSRLAQEADLALNRIAQDLAGLGTGERRRPGSLSFGPQDDDGDGTPELLLAIDQGDRWTGSAIPDGPATVAYRFDPDDRTLERLSDDGGAEPVARYVVGFDVRELPSPWIEIRLVLLHPARSPGPQPRDLRRAYTLIACLP